MNAAVFDELIADGWPPAELVQWRGCRLRYTSGVTRRANSALASGSLQPNEVVSFVERAELFYSDRKAPTQFQVSDSSGVVLSNALTERGYRAKDETIVLWAELERLAGPEAGLHTAWSMTADDRCGDAWFEVYATVDGGRHRSPDARTILRRVLLAPSLPTRFVAAVDSRGALSAVGQVVVDGGTACGQCLATAPEARRQGAGAAVLAALVEQARLLEARCFTVAVQADNAASLGLCRRVGLHESHRYRYFAKPF